MSSLAEMTHECEVCGVELPYRGGPHRPRWCVEHRDVEERKARRGYQAAYQANFNGRARAASPAVYCGGCRSRLLRPAVDGLCGFCQVELSEAA